MVIMKTRYKQKPAIGNKHVKSHCLAAMMGSVVKIDFILERPYLSSYLRIEQCLRFCHVYGQQLEDKSQKHYSK